MWSCHLSSSQTCLPFHLEACTSISGSVYYVKDEARRRRSLLELCLMSLSPPSQTPTDRMIRSSCRYYRAIEVRSRPDRGGPGLIRTLANEHGRWPPPRQLWAENHLFAWQSEVIVFACGAKPGETRI